MQEEDREQNGGRAVLFELRGGQPGAAHPLPRDIFRIGSVEDNDLVLKDRDVKPDQLEISFVEGRFVVKNLAAEGSVFLNGEPFEESTLQKGDILTVGESMFRYVDRGETLSQEDLWRPVGGKKGMEESKKASFRRISFVMFISLLAVGAVLLIMFTQGNKVEEIQERPAGKLVDLEKPVDREELKVHYEHGKDLLAARRWDEAILTFEEIRKQTPNFMDVETLYQEALGESEYVDILNLGKGLVQENELVEGKYLIEQIPKKSVYYREAERLAREIDDMILEKRLQEAIEALARQDWSFAKREAESILATYPNNKDARRIVLEARMLQRQLSDKGSGVHTAWSPRRPARTVPPSNGTAPQGSETKTAAAAPAPKSSKRASSTPREGTPAWFIHSAIAAYRKGETEKSLSYLEKVSKRLQGEKGPEAVKAAALAEDVRSAMAYFQQANSLQQERRYLEAVDVWERFLETDRSIAGDGGGSYFRKASVSLAGIYFERGQREFDRGNPIGAALFWKMGKKINPGNRDLKRGFDQLGEVARKIYREGYSMQEINIVEAIEKWNEVLMIVPPDDPYYRKAKQRLDRYSEAP